MSETRQHLGQSFAHEAIIQILAIILKKRDPEVFDEVMREMRRMKDVMLEQFLADDPIIVGFTNACDRITQAEIEPPKFSVIEGGK